MHRTISNYKITKRRDGRDITHIYENTTSEVWEHISQPSRPAEKTG